MSDRYFRNRVCHNFLQGEGFLFTVSALGASPVGLNYYYLVLPSVLMTARADVTSDFLARVIYDSSKRLKKASSYPPYHEILLYDNIHYTTCPPHQVGATRPDKVEECNPSGPSSGKFGFPRRVWMNR
jgi:hypothetical protein